MNNSKTGGPGIFGVLGVIFVVLKLTGNIGWSWLWVLAPFWAPLALVLFLLIVIGIVGGIASVLKD